MPPKERTPSPPFPPGHAVLGLPTLQRGERGMSSSCFAHRDVAERGRIDRARFATSQRFRGLTLVGVIPAREVAVLGMERPRLVLFPPLFTRLHVAPRQIYYQSLATGVSLAEDIHRRHGLTVQDVLAGHR